MNSILETGDIRPRKSVAVVGSGISGLAAAWLLDKSCDVTIIEAANRIGGHSHTVYVSPEGSGRSEAADGRTPVDIGFIVYNEFTYPNLTALFDYLGVETQATDMSLAVSLGDGELEYAGGYFSQLFVQKRNLARPRFWSMLSDLVRFYRHAPRDLKRDIGADLTLGDYLDANRYGAAFRDDHLLPMAAAIWSVTPRNVLDFPAKAFIQFHDNHGLLSFTRRTLWRTVSGGSDAYVQRIMADFGGRIRTGSPVTNVTRLGDGVIVDTANGTKERYDEVVIAAHADQALGILAQASDDERRLLGAFRYQANRAILHADASLMPKRRGVWSSWNYLGPRQGISPENLMVSYWMNSLQGIPHDQPMFVSLNPVRCPDPALTYHAQEFAHPVLDGEAIKAQQSLWSLQGQDRTWFCGAYFGAGFHEDGLQSGLAVAEAIAGRKRPWKVADESGRIVLNGSDTSTGAREIAA